MDAAQLAELYILFLDQIINRVILFRVLDIIILSNEKTPKDVSLLN